MTSLIPMYLKTTYKNDPLFQNTKTVFSVYNNYWEHKFNGDLITKAKMMDIDDKMLDTLGSGDFEGFIKLGIEYADAVIKTREDFSDKINKLFKSVPRTKKIDVIKKGEKFADSYFNLYNELAG
jgi:starch synthase